MTKFLYFIDGITNIHVGAGDINYNVVDQEVEKDPLTNQPMIHASGLKGAIRAHIESEIAKDDEKQQIYAAFGKKDESTDKEMSENSGAYKFMNAYLLYRPLRACGMDTHINVTSVSLLKDYYSMLHDFGLINEATFNEKITAINSLEFNNNGFIVSFNSNINIEGESVAFGSGLKNEFGDILGEKFAIANNLSDYELPVIARNNLRSESGGLWYEEYVPRESRFYFIILKTDDKCALKVEEYLDKDMIQIGGNASVGYGYCKFSKKYPKQN